MTIEEPPPPTRGQTAEERGPDLSPQEQKVASTRSGPRRLAAAANPRFLLSQADGYPVGIKQFLWFCLILVYPAWLFFLLLAAPVWLFSKVAYGIVWVLFAPLRRWMKKNRPEDYAASQAGPRRP